MCLATTATKPDVVTTPFEVFKIMRLIDGQMLKPYRRGLVAPSPVHWYYKREALYKGPLDKEPNPDGLYTNLICHMVATNTPGHRRFVSHGFHSFSYDMIDHIKHCRIAYIERHLIKIREHENPVELIHERYDDGYYAFMPCVIPQGSNAYIGIDGTVASDQIVIDVTLEQYLNRGKEYPVIDITTIKTN